MDAFSTNRLTAERLASNHLDDLCQMHQDPRVMATLGGLRSEEETFRFLHVSMAHWDSHGYGLWLFRDRKTGEFAGRGGLRNCLVEGTSEVELSYAPRAEFWGRGLASEMAQEILKVGFEILCLTNVVSFTLPTNRGSRRVMEKAGFHFKRDIVHANLPHVLYRLERSSFHDLGLVTTRPKGVS